MKILAVLPSYRITGYQGGIGGGELSNRMLFEALVSKGHRATVFSFHGSGFWGEMERGVTIFDFSSQSQVSIGRKIVGILSFLRLAFRMAQEVNPDLVIGTTTAIAQAIDLGHRLDIPVGAFVRAYENFDCVNGETTLNERVKEILRPILLGQYKNNALENTDFLLANSQYMADLCRRQYDSPRKYVVYPPIPYDPIPFKMNHPITSVVTVGTSPKKGIRLFSELARRMPELRFRIVGDPKVPPGVDLVEENLTRSGWIAEQAAFLKVADIVLVPSTWEEPFGRIAVEGLLHGKIVLVSDRGGLPESVGHERELIVPFDSVEAWQRRLEAVVRSPDDFRRYCESAAKNAKIFALQTQASAFENALLKEIDRCH